MVGRQQGMTLVELMLSLAVGLIVMGSILSIYLSTVDNNARMLSNSKLNQELSALMNVMSNDIRRAGYWGNIPPADIGRPHVNPFAQTNDTALEVHAGNAPQGETGSGDCVIYTYDANGDGVLDDDDIRGFRLNNGVVQMRERGDTALNPTHDSCADGAGTWRDVTDGSLISVTGLTFDLADSACVNTAEPNGVENGGDPAVIDDDEEADCYSVVPAAGGGDFTVESRQVLITIAGTLAGDPGVQRTLTQEVRVRNDLIRER